MLTRSLSTWSLFGFVSMVICSSQSALSAEPESSNTIDLNDNLTRFVLSIGCRETGFDQKEASHDWNNQFQNNRVMRDQRKKGASEKEARAAGGDYGYFQCNQLDVKYAIDLGIDGQVASALNNSQGKGQYTLAEQTHAVIQFIKKSHLKKGLAAIERQDWKTANQVMKKQWPSLPGGKSHHSHLDKTCDQYLAGKDPLGALSKDRSSVSIEQAAGSVNEVFTSVIPAGNTNSSEANVRHSYQKMDSTLPSEARLAQNPYSARAASAR